MARKGLWFFALGAAAAAGVAYLQKEGYIDLKGCVQKAAAGLNDLIDQILPDAMPADGVEAVDADGDGEADTVILDADGDGVADTAHIDADGDGKLDTTLIDTDGDGCFDAVITENPSET